MARSEIFRVQIDRGRADVFLKIDGKSNYDYPMHFVRENGVWVAK